MSDFYARPDWVIIGARMRDQHVVWASRELDHIELQLIYEDLEPWSWTDFTSYFPPRLRYVELSGRLRSFVVVVGTSYADCLARLADFGEPGEWRDETRPTPELPAFPELGSGPPALGPGGDS